MKTLQTILLVSFFVFGLLNNLSAQSIYFCEGVNDDGNPINKSTQFTIPQDGGYLYVLVKLPYEVDCYNVNLEVYRDDEYDNTIKVETKPSWTWFWKKITFYKTGEFAVDVYDCDDELIVSGTVEIDN